MILQTPPAPPPAKPAITIYAKGQGGVRMKVVCHAACTINGELKVDARTARALHIGSSRVAGTIKRVVDPGTFVLTVPLSLKAKQGFKKSKLTLIVAKLTGAAAYADSGISGTKSRKVKITR